MQRCLDLAKNGFGRVEPNPMVGAVIVHQNKIIGEGFHAQYGKPHAEVNAIASVRNKELLRNSTIYVSLEPCSHFGKTPPCASLIVSYQIPRVVIASKDPYHEVAGRGIELLQKNGIVVEIGLLDAQNRNLNKRFFTFIEKQRPYVILKWAQTADGFIDFIRTENTPIAPNWITNDFENQLVHKWRSTEMAIMVATETVLKDNPSLTTRHWFGNSPIRVVIDKDLKIDNSFNIFDTSAKTIIFNALKNEILNHLEFVAIDFAQSHQQIFKTILKELYVRKIQSVIVEGGSKLHQSVIESDLWDEARIFVGNKTFGKGIEAAQLPLQHSWQKKFDASTLFFYQK